MWGSGLIGARRLLRAAQGTSGFKESKESLRLSRGRNGHFLSKTCAQIAGALFDFASTDFRIKLIERPDYCEQLNAIASLVIFMQSNFAKGVDG